jgi:hypothetical protein
MINWSDKYAASSSVVKPPRSGALSTEGRKASAMYFPENLGFFILW